MAQTFLFLVKTAEFFTNFQSGGNARSKTHYRAGELAEREWVECNS